MLQIKFKYVWARETNALVTLGSVHQPLGVGWTVVNTNAVVDGSIVSVDVVGEMLCEFTEKKMKRC